MICVKMTVASNINEVNVSVSDDSKTIYLKVETPIIVCLLKGEKW